jgi:hypothetical protein
MKRIVKKLDNFNTIGIILNANEDAFEDFQEIIDVKEDFINKKSRISSLVSDLNKPKTEVYGVKTDSRNKLRSALKLAIGTGITVAKKQQNNPLLLALKNYKRVLSRTNTHDLPEMANRVYNELKQNETVATGAGLTPEKLTDLQKLTDSFREIIETTDYEFSSRKTARKELNSLVSDCTLILRDEIDAYAGHCKDTFPGFYNAYFTAREPRKSRKKNVADTELADISGTVTDSVTGLPVANATINVLEMETAFTTDADGYYLVDDLGAGAFTLGCHATGYDVPDQVKDEVTAGESVVIDFRLVPTVNPLNN